MFKKFASVSLYALLVLALGVGLVFGITKSVQASYIDHDGAIKSDEVINDDVFMNGETIVIDGVINGTLMATGQTITINGTVNGDAFLAGSKVTIADSAQITGNLFFGCQNAEIKGKVDGSVFGGSASLVTSDSASIERSLYYGGYGLEIQPGAATKRNVYAGVYQAILAGEIGRNVHLGAGAVELNGEIGGDVSIDFGSSEETSSQQPPVFFFPGMNIEMPKPIQPGLRVSPDARIDGKLTYTASRENMAVIESKPTGGVVYQTPVPQEANEGKQPAGSSVKVNLITPLVEWVFKTLRNLVTLLVLGGLAIWLLPELLKRFVAKVKEKPVSSAGYGFMVVIIGYAAAIFAALVVLFVGILFMIATLGGLGGAVFTVGFSGIALALAVFGILVTYGSKLIIAYLGGEWILKKVAPNATHVKVWAMVIGVVVYTLLRSLPLVGWLFGLAATLFGIGALWLVYREYRISHQPSSPVLSVEI